MVRHLRLGRGTHAHTSLSPSEHTYRGEPVWRKLYSRINKASLWTSTYIIQSTTY
jgi:hypothetical protein